MSDLNDLFKVISEGKKHFEENDLETKAIRETKEHIKEDLGSLFTQLSSLKEELEEELVGIKPKQAITEDILVEVSPIPAMPVLRTPEQRIKDTAADAKKYFTDKSFQQPNPDLVEKNVTAIQAKIKFLEQAIGRIAATGPGSGEVNLRWLDDVDRQSIYDGRYLRYSETNKKFEFAEVNPHDIVFTTNLITTPTYTVNSEDYYIGVSRDGPVTITMPAAPSSGRILIIKDESGNCSTNPITVSATVDNDAGGFILQIDNGAVQLIYRNGWRIV